MTPQQAREEFDKLKENKVFKATFLFWEEHKNLIQKSFTKLQNELNELVGKEDQESRFRRGEIFRELEDIKPLPESKEDKAFVAKYWIDFYQKDLETREDPIYSFDHYKQVYENKSRVALNLKDFIEREQKSMNAILENEFWKTKIKLNHKEEIPIKDFILSLANTIDYTFIYEYVDKYSYKVDYLILARLLSPAQYSEFLKTKLDTLQDSKPASSKKSESNISDRGFNLGYTDTQLETLHKAIIDNNFLKKESIDHFKNAFNGEVLAEGFKPLKWIDKTPKNNAGVDGFNAQSLLEFLYLLEMDSKYYDTLPSNQSNFYRLLERVFEGIKNIQSKNITKKPNQKTLRQKLLKTIIQDIKP